MGYRTLDILSIKTLIKGHRCSKFFNKGIRPAVNVGISVSRVGGAAQTDIIKKLGGGVRLALAQYRELAASHPAGSELGLRAAMARISTVSRNWTIFDCGVWTPV